MVHLDCEEQACLLGESIFPYGVARHVSVMEMEVSSALVSMPHLSKNYVQKELCWSFPQPDRRKCNVDGAMQQGM